MESDSIHTVHIDDIDYTDDLYVVHNEKFFTGQAVDYYKNNQICKIESYEDGVKSGLEKSFYPDGSIEYEHWNVGGGPHGVGRTWFPNGQLSSETIYDHGEIVQRKKWAEDGTQLQ
ncbi:toxin-antitoxin system YwqK family antitoxin [Frankia sp. R82]|uniref:toxin-antitoxin system YwqK family antitoxin n=1 Tax=Frankia sp. R82 TaxID=2950553 RepID=UPI002042CE3F|nr:hypothetical protein [Frankia sp. R82]MCM3882848.1 hypothetical protein [Frankia sp. R82]